MQHLHSFDSFAISASTFCNWSGKSPSRCWPPYSQSLISGWWCTWAAFVPAGSTGWWKSRWQTDTEQRGELLRLTFPFQPHPHLTCPNCLLRPSQFVKYGSHPFAKGEREKHYTPLPPPPWWLQFAYGCTADCNLQSSRCWKERPRPPNCQI